MNKWQALEVEWYRANGRYPERIVVDGEGEPYVLGDGYWNSRNPKMAEEVEPQMRVYAYQRMGAGNG
ncbi:hypothetical protein CAL26_09805 [Bordetella genomosp. 9]|uniref:Uncharacterized protein n=1 Tax=Bordetella genomosp. 9 TaxID=1416803 RepID=A0A261RF98_9BORD|nr:hypothetical protein [Bordetella genomosp. 9]OZI23716.1 hypothetical protein CAL26_09805 [Bordetella genomosp. 9]